MRQLSVHDIVKQAQDRERSSSIISFQPHVMFDAGKSTLQQ